MKKPIYIILATILLASVMGGLVFVNAQEEDPAVVAEGLLDQLNITDSDVTAKFDAFIADNKTIPDDAAEALGEAQALYAEAQDAFNSTDYESAIEKAAEAMNKYGEAEAKLVVVEDDEEEEEEEKEDETEDTYKKLGGYERALDRLIKLRDIASDLEADGVDVSEAKALLDSAETILGNIGGAIDQGNFDGLEEMLEQANSMLGEATGLLHSSGTPKRVEKTAHFIAQTRHHVNQLETKLNRIMAKYNIIGDDAAAIQEEFQALKGLLDDLGDDVDKDDLKNITRDLQHIVKESNEVGRDNDDLDKRLLKGVNDVNRKETKLNRYRQRVAALNKRGYNTSNIEELLDQAEDLLNQSQASIDEGDTETAEDLMEQAEDILDEVDDLLDDFEEEHKHGARGDDDDDDEEKGFNVQREKQELLNKINRYRQIIEAKSMRGENTTALEAQLDEIEQALNDAETEEDLDSIEDMLDEIESQIDNDEEDDEEPKEPEEPEGEEG